jgi:hypothetical protein
MRSNRRAIYNLIKILASRQNRELVMDVSVLLLPHSVRVVRGSVFSVLGGVFALTDSSDAFSEALHTWLPRGAPVCPLAWLKNCHLKSFVSSARPHFLLHLGPVLHVCVSVGWLTVRPTRVLRRVSSHMSLGGCMHHDG